LKRRHCGYGDTFYIDEVLPDLELVNRYFTTGGLPMQVITVPI